MFLLNKNNDLVSVIIPVFNSPHTIDRAIKSVLNQTYDNIEILIINDASTDNTQKILEDIKVDNIRIFNFSNNKGPSIARNFGIKKSKGKYIAFLDSDDEWLPDKISKQVDLINRYKDEEWAAVYTGQILIKKNRIVKIFPKDEGNLRLKILYIKTGLATCSTILIRKNVFEEIGYFNEKLSFNEDPEFMIRYFEKYKIAVIPDALVKIHSQPKSAIYIEKGKKQFLDEISLKLDKLDKRKRDKVYAYNYISIAKAFSREKNLEKTFYYFKKSISKKLLFPINYVKILLNLLNLGYV